MTARSQFSSKVQARAFGNEAPARLPGLPVLQRKVYKRDGQYISHALPGQAFKTREAALDAEQEALNRPQSAEHIDHHDPHKQDRQGKRARDAGFRQNRRARQGKNTEPSLDAQKQKSLGLRKVAPDLKAAYEKHEAAEIGGDYGTQGLALALSREDRRDGPYDEHYEQPRLMWRTDTRSPKQVLNPTLRRKDKRSGLKKKNMDAGFQTSAEREGITRKGENTIIYRTGHDDITSASGISVSPDVRSASFFPFGSKTDDSGKHRQQAYLYAIAADHTVNTFEAQKRAEQTETGQKRWRRKDRFQYDPQESHPENTSTVWPYHEHAMHRVGKDQIIAAYEVHQERMDASDSRAGSAFHLNPTRMPRSAEKRGRAHPLREMADTTASLYKDRYPSQPRTFSSYQGQVSFQQMPKDLSSAEDTVVGHEPFAPGRSAPKPRKMARKQAAREQANRDRRRRDGNVRTGGFRGR